MKPAPLTHASDETSFGAKATQLGAALRAGLPVPDGFALPAAFVDAVASGDRAAEAQLYQIFAAIPPPLAVRSSGIGEDSRGTSFAGQHLTLLNVRSSDGLLDAVRRVWCSARSEAALAYRRRMGISEAARIAVVVQRMIEADCAGVLFTKDPSSGADQILVEASYGLGEAVVAGLVNPDRFRLSRRGAILERTIGEKDLMVVADPAGGIVEVSIDGRRAREACLDERHLRLLVSLADCCRTTFESDSHDLEWAFAREQLFLLQRRPITGARP